MFYMSITYDKNIDDEQEKVLEDWALIDDPVSDEERIRHNFIAKVQGNKNPFVTGDWKVERKIDY